MKHASDQLHDATSGVQDARLLDNPRYIAEPKFDEQRAQLYVDRGCAVACYSRPGRELLGLSAS